MNFTEQAVNFDCAGETLLGILTKPENPSGIGVVVIVGGPQYRAGSHRQFVLLSRALATAGFAVLRFDYRGMGDSEGKQRDFQVVSVDIDAAISQLITQVPPIIEVVLWGLCDGASAALLYCHETRDERLTGLCLLNPWARSEVSLAKTQIKHYYKQRLAQKAFWTKLLTGNIALQAISGLLKNLKISLAKENPSNDLAKASYQCRMAKGWQNFSGHILLILSGDDYTAKEFLQAAADDLAWRNAFLHPLLLRVDLPGFDHTFSDSAASQRVDLLTAQWLSNIRSVPAPIESPLLPPQKKVQAT